MPSFSARSEWKIGGMTDANGFLDHPVVANGYFAPDEVRLEGELISWSGLVSERHPGKSVLERFVRLDNKEPAAIAAFVQKWGPLNVADYLRRFLGGTLTVTAP